MPASAAISPARSSAMVVTATPPALITANQEAISHGLFGPAQQHPVAGHQAEVLDQHPGGLVGVTEQVAVGPRLGGRAQAGAVRAEPGDGGVQQRLGAVEPVGITQPAEVEAQVRPLFGGREVVPAEGIDVGGGRQLHCGPSSFGTRRGGVAPVFTVPDDSQWTEISCGRRCADEPVSRIGPADAGVAIISGSSAPIGIATVTLDRPAKLNALTFDSYADLRDLLAELPHRGDVRVLVLRGSGRAFCSGGDVHEIIGATLAMGQDELLAFTRMTGEVIRGMRECPIPIVAGLQGMAAGAGAVIALAADFRVATPAARFAFLFTKVGLSGGDMGAAYLLPRLVGLGRATQLLMLGDTIDAAHAERIGLISELVAEDELDGAVDRLARRLATGPAHAYAQTKALLTREQDMSLSAALELEAMTQALLMTGQDYAEFHAAFTEGRDPRWQGR